MLSKIENLEVRERERKRLMESEITKRTILEPGYLEKLSDAQLDTIIYAIYNDSLETYNCFKK